MIQLQCDYNEGCAPEILQKLVETNLEQTEGYGVDYHCENARRQEVFCQSLSMH